MARRAALVGTAKKNLQIPQISSFSRPSKKPLPSTEEFCPMCFVRERTRHTKVSRLAWNGCSEKTVHR